jgi:hypothetical protein
MQEQFGARNLIIFIVIVFSAAALSAIPGQGARQHVPASGMTISYAVPTHRITLREPVIITFQVVNQTGLPINLDLGQDRKRGFLIAITKPDGVKLEFPVLLREGISTPGEVSVKSDETFTQDLLINEWYDFPLPGKYEIWCRLSKSISLGNSTHYEMDPGFRALVEIEPKDELALAKTCDTLSNQIEASSQYQQAADLTRALSYVEDPIAVPYLRRALFSGKLVEPLAIEGLQKIANDAAVRVLIEALKTEGVDTAVLARSSLMWIKNKTTDQNLRQKIDSALAAN